MIFYLVFLASNLRRARFQEFPPGINILYAISSTYPSPPNKTNCYLALLFLFADSSFIVHCQSSRRDRRHGAGPVRKRGRWELWGGWTASDEGHFSGRSYPAKPGIVFPTHERHDGGQLWLRKLCFWSGLKKVTVNALILLLPQGGWEAKVAFLSHNYNSVTLVTTCFCGPSWLPWGSFNVLLFMPLDK